MIGVARKETTILYSASILIVGFLLGLLLRDLGPRPFFLTLVSILLLAFAVLRLRVALVLIVVGVPLISYRSDLGPVPLDAVTITVAIALAASLVNVVRDVQWRPRGLPYSVPFIIFLLVGLFSLAQALNVIEGIAVWLRFLGYFLLVFAVARAFEKKAHYDWIITLMIMTAAASTLVGLYDFVLRPEESIGLAGLSTDIQGRLAGTYLNPNFFGEYLVLLIPLGLAFSLNPGAPLSRRLGFAVITLFLLAGLALTYTRGSWLSVAVGLLLFALLTEGWLVAVLAGLAGAAVLIVPGLVSRFMSTFSFAGGTVGFRFKLWQIPLGMLKEHPVVGVGIGNYLTGFSEYVFGHPELSVGWVIYGAHNVYLTVGAEMGILGLIALAYIMISFARTGFSLHESFNSKSLLYWRYLNAGILAALASFLVNSLTSNALLHPRAAVFFWLLVGVQGTLLTKTGQFVGAERSTSEKRSLTEGSVIMGSLSFAVRLFRQSWETHYLRRAARSLAAHAKRSRLFGWITTVPYAPSLLESSRLERPVTQGLERIRNLVSESSLLAFIGTHAWSSGLTLLTGCVAGYLIGYTGF